MVMVDNMTKSKICKICGREFIPKSSRQQCCRRPITKTCVICGKTFPGICSSTDTKTTCSDTCAAELIKRNRQSSASKTIKICKWCGKPFHPKSVRDIYCYDKHYQICAVCGKKFEIDPRKNKETLTCSNECRDKLKIRNTDYSKSVEAAKKTNMERYGVDSPMKLDSIKHKAKATCLNRYGVDSYTKTDEYKDKIKVTSLNKYGVDHWLSSQRVKDKRKSTVMNKYGVDNVAKNNLVKSKIRSVVKSKYGVSNISQYHIPDLQRWGQFKESPSRYITNRFEETPITISALCKDLGVSRCSIYNNMSDEDFKLIKRSYSYMEEEVANFLKSNNIEYLAHDRCEISPYELDFYIPDSRVAIECNPTYTHSSTPIDHSNIDVVDTSYHKMKTDMCEEKNIRLIHIFGPEWSYKRRIIEDIITSACNCNSKTTIYARACTLSDNVPFEDALTFANSYHLQGYCPSSIRLGLYKSEELVALMAFGRPRKTIGDNKEDFELLRYCVKSGYQIVGGASKLFKSFVYSHPKCTIVSYCDRSHFSGKMYTELGFKLTSISSPGYFWCKPNKEQKVTRYQAQKRNLSKLLNDDTIDLKDTEDDIMISHGYSKVFDSGVSRWVFTDR